MKILRKFNSGSNTKNWAMRTSQETETAGLCNGEWVHEMLSGHSINDQR